MLVELFPLIASAMTVLCVLAVGAGRAANSKEPPLVITMRLFCNCRRRGRFLGIPVN